MHHGLDPVGVPFQLFEHLFRRPEVGDRVFGQILPLAQIGRLQPVDHDNVAPPLGAQACDDVRADETGPARHYDHASDHRSPFIFSTVFVVE